VIVLAAKPKGAQS